MRPLLHGLAAVLAFGAGSLAAEHPAARAKVGEWAWYATKETRERDVPSASGIPWYRLGARRQADMIKRGHELAARADEAHLATPQERRRTVVSRTATQVVVALIDRAYGRTLEITQTIDLTEPFERDMKEIARGREVLAIGEQRYDTDWVEYEILSMPGMTKTMKIWRSPRAPIDGEVKIESQTVYQGTTTRRVSELVMFGQEGTSAR